MSELSEFSNADSVTDTLQTQNTTDKEISSEEKVGVSSQDIGDERERILDSFSSSIQNAKNMFPSEIEELKTSRSEILPISREKDQEREESLHNYNDDATSKKSQIDEIKERQKERQEEINKLEEAKFVPFKKGRIEKKKGEIEELTKTLDDLSSELNQVKQAKEDLDHELEQKPELEPLKKRFKELAPLFTCDLMTQEQKEKVFNPDFLSQISTEEYLKVWRLGSPHYTAHVTRQGIYNPKTSDINPIVDTNKIVQENHFKEMLSGGGNLESTMSAMWKINLSEEIDEDILKKNVEIIKTGIPLEDTITDLTQKEISYGGNAESTPMGKWERENLQNLRTKMERDFDQKGNTEEFQQEFLRIIKDEELLKNLRLAQLQERISDYFNPKAKDIRTDIPYIVDKSAIHLSSDEVLDKFYGSEDENQIFVIFPSDLIASQYTFGISDEEQDLTKKPTGPEKKWNDIFVWTDNQAIPLDAGFVFLPGNTPVNPETGSKYEIQDGTIIDSENTVLSKDYWESYFQQNPEQKPKHLVYYDNKFAPTKAVENFLLENNIIKIKPQERNLGFEKNIVNRKTFYSDNERITELRENAEVLLEKMNKIATSIVEEEFQNNPIPDEAILEYLRNYKSTLAKELEGNSIVEDLTYERSPIDFV